MRSHSGKHLENQSRAVANRFLQQGSQPVPTQLADNRPVAIAQRKLQESAGQQMPLQRQGAPEEEELLQGKFDPVQMKGGLEEEELLQGKFDPVQMKGGLEEEELLQGKFSPIQQKENKTGMPDQLKSGIESLSGIDMSDVQVHHNSPQPAQLNALAYAQGTDIHVAPGQDKHLAHEAWHVAQQKQGRVQPTMSLKGQNINDDPGLEREADTMGTKALQAKRLDDLNPA